MEVAGRWRREWAGAAEYGKVARDGVVVRTARALEVLQASGPGGRMRVTRSAFHAQGPLSTTFLLHSSTRTILSSGADVLLSPSLVSKPLELSSTPLDTASDGGAEGEPEAYRVTEPDDTDISEPSKWRSSGGRRGPGSTSSSADTASLVDTVGRPSFAVNDYLARPSFDRKPAGTPLMKISEHARYLETSAAGDGCTSDEWHDRRNSYGFERSLPNDIKKLTEDDKIGMESSTDSGICKSTEIVNIPIEKYKHSDVETESEELSAQEERQETFQDWLAKNRSIFKSKTDYSSTRKSSRNNNGNGSRINLKSSGKISIALPNSSDRESDDSRDFTRNTVWVNNDDSDRRFKKVGFSKTELHFTAESGKVKIIETDDKPPPTNDFRRRRTAFEPIKNRAEKPITLFGGDIYVKENSVSEKLHFDRKDNIDDFDQENDSAMKSILKNKIPKPKPYLLGEDVMFGERRNSDEGVWGIPLRGTPEANNDKEKTNSTISVLNESLKSDHIYTKKNPQEQTSTIMTDTHHDRHNRNKSGRESIASPVDYVNISDVHKDTKPLQNVASTQTTDDFIVDITDEIRKRTLLGEMSILKDPTGSIDSIDVIKSVHEKMKLLQMSPVLQNRVKARHLRQNELSYFGVIPNKSEKPRVSKVSKEMVDTPLEEVSRHKRLPNNVTKDSPLYQNLPVQLSTAPVPAPRTSARTRERATHANKSSRNTHTSQPYPTAQNDGENDRSANLKKPTRELETINEFKIVSQGSNEKSRTKHRSSRIEGKPNSSSPSVIRVDTRKSKSLSRSGSKESERRSRDSSVEDAARASVTVPASRPRRSRSADQQAGDYVRTPHAPSHALRTHKVTKECNEDNISYAVLEQKPEKCNTMSPGAVDSLPKKLNRDSSERYKDESLQRKHSNDIRSSKLENNNRGKENLIKPNEKANIHDQLIKRTSRTKPEEHSERHKSRRREYVLSYDDKNGTLSSISKEQPKHSSSGRHDKAGVVSKIEERPRDKTKTSRPTMVPCHNVPGRSKTTDRKGPRRKPKEVA